MTKRARKLKRALARLDLIQYQRENEKGLPRPLASHGDSAKPVAWTQSGTAWGRLDGYRTELAQRDGLCLVCGEEVLSGVVFWSCVDDTHPVGPYRWFDPPNLVEHHELDNRRISDNAPLHDSCAKITRAHCAHIRERLHKGTTVAVPYVGPVLYGHA